MIISPSLYILKISFTGTKICKLFDLVPDNGMFLKSLIFEFVIFIPCISLFEHLLLIFDNINSLRFTPISDGVI